MNLPVTEHELQALVDDLLPAARRIEVEAYLLSRPAEAERVQAYREQNRALHALFDPVLQEPIPPALATRPAAANLAWMRGIAAGLVLLLSGGVAGWLLHGSAAAPVLARSDAAVFAGASGTGHIEQVADDALAHHAAVAHATFSPEALHPVEVGADQETHLVAWLSKRLGTPLRPPKLSALGYDLIGGRLLPGDDGPVAQFMYQDNAAHRITLYVSTEQSSKRETGFRFSQEGGVSVFYWIDGKFGYALSAEIPKPALGRIADAVYRQLEPSS
jgi:anti-sigma factor RsiW